MDPRLVSHSLSWLIGKARRSCFCQSASSPPVCMLPCRGKHDSRDPAVNEWRTGQRNKAFWQGSNSLSPICETSCHLTCSSLSPRLRTPSACAGFPTPGLRQAWTPPLTSPLHCQRATRRSPAMLCRPHLLYRLASDSLARCCLSFS